MGKSRMKTRCCGYEFDPAKVPGAKDPRIGCPVFWNVYNHVVQCHNCGHVWVPDELDPMLVAMERVTRTSEADAKTSQ